MIKRFFTLIISFLFICSTIFDVDAIASSEFLTTGMIITNDDINLQNIKIDIFKSILVSEDNGLCEYNNIYQKSVYTNEEGYYSFSKPSENYTISIDTSSLPEKTGVVEKSQLIESTDKLMPMQISLINDVFIFDENEIVVTDKNGNFLSTDISFDTGSNLETLSKSLMGDYLTINANGYVKDVLKRNTCEYKVFSEEEKIEYYLSIVNDKSIEHEMSYSNIVGELEEYYKEHPNTELSKRIIKSISFQDSSLLRTLTPPFEMGDAEDLVSVSEGSPYYYSVTYNKNDITANQANTFLNYIKAIHNWYYTQYGYNVAQKSNDGYYHFFFAPDIQRGETVNGYTQGYTNGSSAIIIKYDGSQSEANIKRTIAHEMFHSIQRKYNGNKSMSASGMYGYGFLSEALATWAGLQYTGRMPSDYARKQANRYLKYKTCSFLSYDDGDDYGMYLFFDYFTERYGNTNSMNIIKSILESIDNYASQGEYSSIDIWNIIESEIEAREDITFEAFFSYFSTQNANVKRYDRYDLNWKYVPRVNEGVRISNRVNANNIHKQSGGKILWQTENTVWTKRKWSL